jgi:hypothetical protein
MPLKVTGDLVSAADWNALDNPFHVAEVTAGTAATLTLNLPSGFTSAVRVVGKVRSNAAVVTSEVTVGLAGISGTNFYRQLRHVWAGTTLGSALQARTSNWQLGSVCPGTTAIADEFGDFNILISPQLLTGRITAQWQAGSVGTTTDADTRTVIGSGRAAGTAYTQIVVAAGGSFVVGTRVELWPG